MAHTVIIGAGLTGISTAYHLEQHNIFDYKLFEKESNVGGLCRSVERNGFTFDFTGHLLHASDSYFYDLIQSVIGLNHLNRINRRSFVYSHETYTKYPFQINLYGLPPDVIVDCISGFINRKKYAHPQTFREWVQTHFGEGFGKHFFYNYQEKIFAYPIDKITASWTGRFVPETSLKQILYGSLTDASDELTGYNARFLYPQQGGIQSWVHTFADHITSPIHTEHCVKSIDMHKKIVTFTNGHSEPYTLLINTMPLDRLLSLLKEPSSSTLFHAQKHLRCNTVVNFNIGVNRPDLSDKHWIYFPEKKYPFYRIGFWHNFAKSMVPEGCSSLYGEFAYQNKSAEWVNETTRTSIASAKQLFNIADSDVATEKVFTISHAYVTYDHWREKHLPALLQTLEQNGIYSTGRYGAWKYASMQEAVLDGRQAAREVMKYETTVQSPTHYQKELERT